MPYKGDVTVLRHYVGEEFRDNCQSEPSTSNIYLRRIHSTGSLDWCMLHCSGTPCRLNCLTSSLSLSPVAGKSERATLDSVWLCYFAQLEFSNTKQSLTINLLCFGVLLNKPNRQNETNMGIPVNEKCMLLRVGAGGNAYLDNIVGAVVIWKITAKREGEKWEGTWVPHCDIDLSVWICLISFRLIPNHSLASMPYVLLSYRSCVQVKLQICGRSRLRMSQVSQLKKTIQEPQMKSEMRYLQRCQTIAFNTWCSSF